MCVESGSSVLYDEFLKEIGRAGLTVREFAHLLEMRPNSISNNRKRGEVPMHLAVIASLLAELKANNVPIEPIFQNLKIKTKNPRGAASTGKFGGDKQGKLEFGE